MISVVLCGISNYIFVMDDKDRCEGVYTTVLADSKRITDSTHFGGCSRRGDPQCCLSSLPLCESSAASGGKADSMDWVLFEGGGASQHPLTVVDAPPLEKLEVSPTDRWRLLSFLQLETWVSTTRHTLVWSYSALSAWAPTSPHDVNQIRAH